MEEQLPKRGPGRPRIDDTTEYAPNESNDRTRANSQRWKRENPEKWLEYQREYQRKYRKANRERANEISAEAHRRSRQRKKAEKEQQSEE